MSILDLIRRGKRLPSAETSAEIAAVEAEIAGLEARQIAAEQALASLATLTEAEHASAEAECDVCRRGIQRAKAKLDELRAAHTAALAKEADEALTARRAEIDRRVEVEGGKLLDEYDRLAARMAPVLAKNRDLDREVEAINRDLKAAGRAGEWIKTAHERFRFRRGEQEPDRVEIVKEWQDADGNRVVQFVKGEDGAMVPRWGGKLVDREVRYPGRKRPDVSLPSLDKITLPPGRLGGKPHWPKGE